MLAGIMTLNASDLRHCSIAATLSLIGEKWTILILRDVFHGVTRFDDFLRRLECSPAVLSARLKTLTDAGLLRKVGYREPGERERFEYRPTRAAVELLPVLVGLMQWGDGHMTPAGEGPVQIRSRASGKLVRAALVDEDGVEVSPRDMRIVPVNAHSPASDQ
ncbi:HxlR family transcriptional regulator [Cupriavidus sp. SK-4]|uniref:winged helix-turn-helix transcriptional regulator n=1 Tax=Cupriavidus sp. SK-4 TaxID=574750 RepID=UPI00044B3538|nr:helix-turn-helix domain-containing protein [Cupriavidus sp. SK-4]EYS93450.1 HxlR family transcriptional regulator [Cupriavidus sp. SK-4]